MKMNLQQAEAYLETKYSGKNCCLTVPGYKPVYGMVDRISIDTLKLPEQEVIIQINYKRYTVSFDSLTECLQLLRHE